MNWERIAVTAWKFAHWADTRAHLAASRDVTEQLRHPLKWAMRHPLITVRRKRDRRR